MIFHENRLLAADDSHVISSFMSYFFQKLGKIRQNLLSAAVMIGALRVKSQIWSENVKILSNASLL